MTDGHAISLDGSWSAYPDPDGVGIERAWFNQPPSAGVTLDVPGAWQHAIPDDGPDVVWYRRQLDIPPGWLEGHRAWLVFDAVSTDTRAWIDGREVGSSGGDWMPFQFDVTEQVRGRGRCVLTVRVDRVRPEPQVMVEGHPMQRGHLTKGFHDVTSMQHAGIWQSVRLERCGPIRPVPDGVQLRADPRSGAVTIWCELEARSVRGTLRATVRDAAGHERASAAASFDRNDDAPGLTLRVDAPESWSPETPTLYHADVAIETDAGTSYARTVRFGFRRVETGGHDARRILLNGRPVYVSGVLDWGHEPRHIAPAAPRDEYRGRLERLKAMGFNCVCLCMWYPPEWFHDLCDELGMLIWQEHPVWKTDMADARLDEYRAQYPRFFRRDQNHPSVAIVAGACEHHAFNPKLAEWWWNHATERMPDRVLQIQTAFLDWTDLERTHLYDEHVYESSGRWVRYLRDLEADLATRDPKPLVMGESVLYVSWPDTPELRRAAGDGRPWWAPAALDELRAVERHLTGRFGDATPAHLRERAHRSHRLGRKFQTETARMLPGLAGLVENHLRDVMICPCGLMDDLDTWRFPDDEIAQWASPAVFLLSTPGELRGLPAGRRATLKLGISNYGPADRAGPVTIRVHRAGQLVGETVLDAPARQGAVAFFAWTLDVPGADRPAELIVTARGEGVAPNRWSLWSIPEARPLPGGVARLDALPFAAGERAFDFPEKRYSSGWGLPVRTWETRFPDAGRLVPDARPWDGAGAPDAGVLVAHRLTGPIVSWLAGGGRVLLLASKARGCPPTEFLTHFGQVPFVPARGPLAGQDTTWIGDLTDLDLTYDHVRSVNVNALGIVDRVDPIVRMLYLHDTSAPMKIYDGAFASRVGDGLLCVSSLDHFQPAGRWLLSELLAWLAAADASAERALELEAVRSWTVEAQPEHDGQGDA